MKPQFRLSGVPVKRGVGLKPTKKRRLVTVKEIEDVVLHVRSKEERLFPGNQASIVEDGYKLNNKAQEYSYQHIRASVIIQRNYRGFLTRFKGWNFSKGQSRI